MTGTHRPERSRRTAPSDVDRILCYVKGGELLENYETVRVAKGGRLIDVSLTVSPVRDPAGRIDRGRDHRARHLRAQAARAYRQAQHEATRLLAEAAEPAAAMPS